MRPETETQRLGSTIRAVRFRFSTEDELQRGLELVLTKAGFSFEREVPISPADRLDFLVGRTAIEVKIAGSRASLVRQIERYAQSDRIDRVMVVTNRARLTDLPVAVNGKPVHVVSLAADALL